MCVPAPQLLWTQEFGWEVQAWRGIGCSPEVRSESECRAVQPGAPPHTTPPGLEPWHRAGLRGQFSHFVRTGGSLFTLKLFIFLEEEEGLHCLPGGRDEDSGLEGAVFAEVGKLWEGCWSGFMLSPKPLLWACCLFPVLCGTWYPRILVGLKSEEGESEAHAMGDGSPQGPGL